MAYKSKYTGAETDALLDKINNDNVGKIDAFLSTTSEKPVTNKVLTVELNKKVSKTEMEERSFFKTIRVSKDSIDSYREATNAEVAEWEEYKRRQEAELGGFLV
jgi:hypothetical protein